MQHNAQVHLGLEEDSIGTKESKEHFPYVAVATIVWIGRIILYVA